MVKCKCGHELMEKEDGVSGEVHLEHLKEIETPNELILMKRMKCFYCGCTKPEPVQKGEEKNG